MAIWPLAGHRERRIGSGLGIVALLRPTASTGLLQGMARPSKVNGGKAPRAKGNRAERALVRFLQERGFSAERIPLSGSAGGRYSGDISLPLLGVDRIIEVKCRANGFRALYAWLDGASLVIVRADRREPLVILPLRLAAEIAEAAERGRAAAQ